MNTKILEEAQQARRGVTVYVYGNTIAGGVVNITDNVVEFKNQSSTKIIVALESIDGVAMS